VGFDDAIFKTVVVTDEWIVEGFECGLKFERNDMEVATGVDDIVRAVPF